MTVEVTNTQTPAAETPPSRPEWLPEKFQNPEDLSKAYTESQRKITELSEQVAKFTKQDEKPPETKAPETPVTPPTENVATEDLVKQGAETLQKLSPEVFTKVQDEFNETGEMSEASIQSIVDLGIPRETIDIYVAGVQALATQQTTELYNVFGGHENFQIVKQWAAAMLPVEELQQFNTDIQGDFNKAMTSAKALMHTYTRANGVIPKSQLVGHAVMDGSSTYASKAEYLEDLTNPLYKENSPAGRQFKKAVHDKLDRSSYYK